MGQLFEDFNLIKIEFDNIFNYDNELKKYALLTFDSKENRDRAYADLNFTKLDTIPIRLVLADDETRRIISTNDEITLKEALKSANYMMLLEIMAQLLNLKFHWITVFHVVTVGYNIEIQVMQSRP